MQFLKNIALFAVIVWPAYYVAQYYGMTLTASEVLFVLVTQFVASTISDTIFPLNNKE